MAAPECAAYLRDVVGGDERKPDWTRINTAQFILKEHLSGLRREGLVDEAGNRIVSYRALILLAEQYEAKEENCSDQPLEET